MGLSVAEQETTITFSRDSNECKVWTSDTTMMTKLDKLANDPDSEWKLLRSDQLRNTGEIVAKLYGTMKHNISYRKKKVERDLTDEERRLMAARLKVTRDKLAEEN